MSTSSCNGSCCRHFSIGLTPEELRVGMNILDGDKLRSMLVHLGHFEVGQVEPSGKIAEYESDFYTCRHFDAATSLCTDYDDRPAMCRDYPYGGVCRYEDCTWAAGKNLKHPSRLVVRRNGAVHLRLAPPSTDNTVTREIVESAEAAAS